MTFYNILAQPTVRVLAVIVRTCRRGGGDELCWVPPRRGMATITHCCDVAAAACGSCVWRNVALLWLPCRHLFWAVALSVWRKVQWTPLLLFSPRARVLSFTNSLWATNLKSLLYWIKHFTDCMIFYCFISRLGIYVWPKRNFYEVYSSLRLVLKITFGM